MERLTSGTGSSGLDDARQAGQEAAESAVQTLEGAEPALVLVYASVRYDLTEALAGVRSVTGSTPLAGFTSSGHFAGGEVAGPGEGLVVLVLAGDYYRFGIASATGMQADPEAVGTNLARAAKAAAKHPDDLASHPYAAMILFTAGIGGDPQAVLSGVHRVCGAAVPVVGGAASDDLRMSETSVFHDSAVLTDAAVGVWINSPRPLTVTSAHGWTPISLPLLITRLEGAMIYEIGGRPASEVFAELTPTSVDSAAQADGGELHASYALGVIEPDGTHLIRGVFSTPEGPIRAFTPLPAYSAVQVMSADPTTLLSVIDGVVEEAMMYGDEKVLLAFDCIARMDIMGTAYPDEVAAIGKAAHGARCFGSYTYGEFARVTGVGGVHNATLTTLAL